MDAMIEAKVICDSINNWGNRLTTMRVVMHRYILAEFNTHRVFSRNASSSRAIPTQRLIQEVRSDVSRAAPIHWGTNRPGMVADEELTGGALQLARDEWRLAAMGAADHAERLLGLGVHKQVVNRVLEPYRYVPVIVSSTSYDNFFELRRDKAAQPEMSALAERMWEAYQVSVPLAIEPGRWHLPFVEGLDSIEDEQTAIKVSVARCARVSYRSFVTHRRATVAEDIELHDRLLASRHLSPFEHPATPDEKAHIDPDGPLVWMCPQEHGNFCGWRQRRKQIPGG
jgi:thymidylate synthase ThyX